MVPATSRASDGAMAGKAPEPIKTKSLTARAPFSLRVLLRNCTTEPHAMLSPTGLKKIWELRCFPRGQEVSQSRPAVCEPFCGWIDRIHMFQQKNGSNFRIRFDAHLANFVRR